MFTMDKFRLLSVLWNLYKNINNSIPINNSSDPFLEVIMVEHDLALKIGKICNKSMTMAAIGLQCGWLSIILMLMFLL